MYKELNKMIPIVEKQEMNAKRAMLFLVSNLLAIARLMTLAMISAMAVEEDRRNRLPGRVSK